MQGVGLSVSPKDLGAVTVKGNRQIMVIRADTTEFDATSFKTPPNSKAQDLMKRIPGLTIDANGKLIFNGKPVVRILVDGRTFFDDDGGVALKNIPNELIDKVQIFYNVTGDKALSDLSGVEQSKVLNIKLKSGNKYFGNTFAGLGSTSRFDLSGFVSAKRDNRTISIDGGFNNVNGLTAEMFNPNRFLPSLAGGELKNFNSKLLYEQNNNAISIDFSQPMAFRDLQSSKEQIIVENQRLGSLSNTQIYEREKDYTFSFTKKSPKSFTLSPFWVGLKFGNLFNSKSDFAQTSILDGEKLNQSESEYESTGKSVKFQLKSAWVNPDKTKLLKASQIFVNANYSKLNDVNHALLSFYNANSIDSTSFLNQRIDQRQGAVEADMRNTFGIFLSKVSAVSLTSSIKGNLQSQERITKNLSLTNIFDNLDSLNSNKFNSFAISTETNLSYMYNSIGKLRLKVGMSLFQNFRNQKDLFGGSHVRQNQWNLTPNILAGYNKILAGLTVRSTQPTIEQIQPNFDNRNPLIIRSGNPDLQNSLSLGSFLQYKSSYNKANKSSTTKIDLNFDPVKNKIITTVNYDSAGKQIQTFTNINGTFSAMAKVLQELSYKIGDQLIAISGAASFNFQKDRLLVNRRSLTTNNLGFKLELNGKYSFGDKVAANLNYSPVVNSLSYLENPAANQNYLINNLLASLELYILNKFKVNNSFTFSHNTGLASNVKRSSIVYNMGLSTLILKNKAEVKFSAFDLFKQYSNVNREIGINYIEDTFTNNIRQYFMLGFAYNFSDLKE